MKKRVIIQRLDEKSDVLSRVEKLMEWSQDNSNNDQISLRVYTSQDDETLLVEQKKKTFDEPHIDLPMHFHTIVF